MLLDDQDDNSSLFEDSPSVAGDLALPAEGLRFDCSLRDVFAVSSRGSQRFYNRRQPRLEPHKRKTGTSSNRTWFDVE